MHNASHQRRGFTIIELLVVIGIILVLIGITFAVGRSVVGDAKKRTTEDTLRVLDTALQAYIQTRGDNPPVKVRFTNTTNNQTNTLVAIDGVTTDGLPSGATTPQLINSVGVFIAVAQQVPESKAILDRLSAKQLAQLDIDFVSDTQNGPQPTLPTGLDAWGRPIRFVHPKADGVIQGDVSNTTATNQDVRRLEAWPAFGPEDSTARYLFGDVRRNNYDINGSGDSDGGKASGSRPYFYSAGEDGLVGYGQRDGVWVNFNLDNVYLSEPTFAKAPQ
jgi:prepilin-type N-terminal cleavage/methylation domain-containing protein